MMDCLRVLVIALIAKLATSAGDMTASARQADAESHVVCGPCSTILLSQSQGGWVRRAESVTTSATRPYHYTSRRVHIVIEACEGRSTNDKRSLCCDIKRTAFPVLTATKPFIKPRRWLLASSLN